MASKGGELRAALLGRTQPTKTEVVDLGELGKIEVRTPTVGVRNECSARSRLPDSDAKDGSRAFNPVDFLLRIAIACSYEEGTNKRVFKDSDYTQLVQLPSGTDWLDKLTDAAGKVVGQSKDSAKGN
jgi:hypothetical protein